MMRAWLYDRLTTSVELQAIFGGVEGIKDRVIPRRSESQVPNSMDNKKPFLVYGLGNSTAEQLMDSTDPNAEDAERQFFQVWIHDEGGSFELIDSVVPIIKRLLVGQSDPASRLVTVIYLETSQEFNNETYGTIFRYIRFQAILARGGTS